MVIEKGLYGGALIQDMLKQEEVQLEVSVYQDIWQ